MQPPFRLHCTMGAPGDFLNSLKYVKVSLPLLAQRYVLSLPLVCAPIYFPIVLGVGKHHSCSCPLHGGWAQLGMGTTATGIDGGLVSPMPAPERVGGTSLPPCCSNCPHPAEPNLHSAWLDLEFLSPQAVDNASSTGREVEGQGGWRRGEGLCLWAGKGRKGGFSLALGA